MICEFALEPELVATWHDRKAYLFFEEKFGLKTRRIVSAYPKKWSKQVWESFRTSPYSNDQNAARNLTALLRDLTQNMVKRRSTFTEISTWLERAEAEHAERPFHAILANKNPRGKDHVITADRLIAEGHTSWSVPDNPPVARNADEFVATMAPLLRTCRHIVFFDPYFDPTKRRFMKPFQGFIDEIWTNRYGCEDPEVELHTSIDRFFKVHEIGKTRDSDQERRVCSELSRNFENYLSKIIPAEKNVRVTIWKQRNLGQKLHNRYIISEICGVAFGTGLDQNDDLHSTATDDLHFMNEAMFSARKRECLGSPVAFDYVIDPFEITGSVK
ncbi:hypothetical protein KAI46_08630 [bacterium]|nr:hypothetical protein [bacterium]